MTPAECFSNGGAAYLVYLPNGGRTDLDLTGASGNFNVRWLNPHSGGALKDRSVNSVKGGGKVSLGNPPTEVTEDWFAVVRR